MFRKACRRHAPKETENKTRHGIDGGDPINKTLPGFVSCFLTFKEILLCLRSAGVSSREAVKGTPVWRTPPFLCPAGPTPTQTSTPSFRERAFPCVFSLASAQVVHRLCRRHGRRQLLRASLCCEPAFPLWCPLEHPARRSVVRFRLLHFQVRGNQREFLRRRCRRHCWWQLEFSWRLLCRGVNYRCLSSSPCVCRCLARFRPFRNHRHRFLDRLLAFVALPPAAGSQQSTGRAKLYDSTWLACCTRTPVRLAEATRFS